ncbi:YscO family type III secretion system apparatus protein [uncultured Endozoicomonas sp.]|uniref:type III secretion system stalk subunit SctO n=1 Tax=uncultured Endozoicomonas sp. TaxID=432652 RepID=UPI002607941B|nr:YscO family type III secretion system apparatus protein [uncultured Endozoicomonas sp.]
MLKELLKVKKIREESAEREVRRCEDTLEQRKKEVADRKRELAEYIDWRCKEEQQLYDNIMNTSVVQNDLDKLKQKVAIMREKDVAMEEAISEAEKQVVSAEEALESAKEKHVQAKLAVEKFEEFCKVQDEEAAKEALRLEDLEMEEFTGKSKQ